MRTKRKSLVRPTTYESEQSVAAHLLTDWPGRPAGYLGKVIAAAPASFAHEGLGQIVALARDLIADGRPGDTRALRKAADHHLLAELQGTGVSAELAESDAQKVWKAWCARELGGFYSDGGKELNADPTAALAAAPGRLRALADLCEESARSDNGRPKAISLCDAVRLPETAPEMLFAHRVLKTGESWLVVGPTGAGKSVMAVEASMLWALGKSYLGFEPVRPLRSVLFVAEDDDDEMAWFRDGIALHHRLSEEDMAAIRGRIHFVAVADLTGEAFVKRDVTPALEAHKPDLVILNPALAYAGCEAKDQRQVGSFLREGLHPVLSRFSCGGFIYHHTPKPPSNRKDEAQRLDADRSYDGFGSVEWSNWARGIITLTPSPEPGVFRLVAPKRGRRLGWMDEDGNPAVVRFVAHAKEPGALGWRDAEASEIPQIGRRKSIDPDKVLALLAKGPLKTTEWKKLADSELGVGRTTFYDIKAALLKAERIWESPVYGWQIKQVTGGEHAKKSGKSGKSVL